MKKNIALPITLAAVLCMAIACDYALFDNQQKKQKDLNNVLLVGGGGANCTGEDFETGNIPSSWDVTVTGGIPYDVVSSAARTGSYGLLIGPSSCGSNCFFANTVNMTRSFSTPLDGATITFYIRRDSNWGCYPSIFINNTNPTSGTDRGYLTYTPEAITEAEKWIAIRAKTSATVNTITLAFADITSSNRLAVDDISICTTVTTTGGGGLSNDYIKFTLEGEANTYEASCIGMSDFGGEQWTMVQCTLNEGDPSPAFNITVEGITEGTYHAALGSVTRLGYEDPDGKPYTTTVAPPYLNDSCTITITDLGAIGQPIKGTFSGTVSYAPALGAEQLTITKGEFSVKRQRVD